MFPDNEEELFEEDEDEMYADYTDENLKDELAMFNMMKSLKLAGKNVMIINQQYYY